MFSYDMWDRKKPALKVNDYLYVVERERKELQAITKLQEEGRSFTTFRGRNHVMFLYNLQPILVMSK